MCNRLQRSTAQEEMLSPLAEAGLMCLTKRDALGVSVCMELTCISLCALAVSSIKVMLMKVYAMSLHMHVDIGAAIPAVPIFACKAVECFHQCISLMRLVVFQPRESPCCTLPR